MACMLLVAASDLLVRSDGRFFTGELVSGRGDQVAFRDLEGVVLYLREDQIDWSRSRLTPRPAQRPRSIHASAATPIRVSEAPQPRRWTGQPISLDLKDADLDDVFRLIANLSQLNMVVSPEVEGRITLKLRDVPWDQVLDLICRMTGLVYTIEGRSLDPLLINRDRDTFAAPRRLRGRS